MTIDIKKKIIYNSINDYSPKLAGGGKLILI